VEDVAPTLLKHVLTRPSVARSRAPCSPRIS